MTTFGTRLMTWFKGRFVGEDEFGSRYYRGRGRRGYPRERRWVIYRGEAEASRVPPEWHAWLHHMVDEVPQPRQRYAWEKPHEPNLTGTPQSYHPRGSVLRGGHRVAATGDYEPWTPE